MTNPVPGYSVSTAYGISGSMWTGCGYHTGVDIAAPRGTTVVAAISGQIRHRSYGSAFGPYAFSISPDPGEPFGDGEVFYAHVLNRLADGTRVEMGQAISEVGDLGNATGPHLHFEFHPDCKDCWYCGCFANPDPVLKHGGSAPPSSGGGSDSYPVPTSNKVYVSKLKYGQDDSDSVWYLQDTLNKHPLSGGATLPTTAFYGDMTDAEVIKCQNQHGFGNDPPGTSYVGPSQAEHLFGGSGLTVVYDTGNPSPPDSETPPPSQGLPEAPALMLPGAEWNPITNFPGLRPFKGSAKKVTLHTTETGSKPNWESQQSGIPHLTVSLITKQRWQHLPFDIAAYTLNGGDHSPNSDSGVNIQIEIIGYTSQCPNWSQAEYDDLEEILVWLRDHVGVPYDFPLPFDSAVRCAWDGWEGLSGIVGHCHAPYNDHSDPTGLRIDMLVTPDTEPEPEPPPGDYVTKQEFNDFKEMLASAFVDLADKIDP